MDEEHCAGSTEADSQSANSRGIPPFRMISDGGGALALLYVPEVRLGQSPLLDIELLTPDRLVRYLAREIEPDFLTRLADSLFRGAIDPFPEQQVPSVYSNSAGLVVDFVESTDQSVSVQVSVVSMLGADIEEPDEIGFDLPRSALVAASHRLQEFNAALTGVQN